MAGCRAITCRTGRAMATVVADHLAGHDVAHVVASSLTRARETAAPIAARHTLHVETDDRVIEAANDFEGSEVALKTFLSPRTLLRYRDPLRPSWGLCPDRRPDVRRDAVGPGGGPRT